MSIFLLKTGTNWYHPHHHGASRMQVFGGMAGALIVEDEATSDPALLAMDDVVAVVQPLYLEPNPKLDIESIASNNGSSTLPVDLVNPYNISRNLLVVRGSLYRLLFKFSCLENSSKRMFLS